MTQPGPRPFDPAMARALDRFDAPSPTAGFLDRIAAMPAVDALTLPAIPRRRLFGNGRRGAWARRASIGVIALGIASATAATTGVFPKLHIAFPATIAAMLTPAPKVEAHHGHTTRHVATTDKAAAATPANAEAEAPILPGVDPAARAARREQMVSTIQQRFADRGLDVPKPVIRRQIAVRQIAVGAAVRGDMTTPLPPRMEAIRDRAATYLEQHPRLRDRLRARVEAADAARGAAPGAQAANDGAVAAPPASSEPAANWTERRLRAFRRAEATGRFQTMGQAREKAQEQAREQAQDQKNPPPPENGEGNSAAPR